MTSYRLNYSSLGKKKSLTFKAKGDSDAIDWVKDWFKKQEKINIHYAGLVFYSLHKIIRPAHTEISSPLDVTRREVMAK